MDQPFYKTQTEGGGRQGRGAGQSHKKGTKKKVPGTAMVRECILVFAVGKSYEKKEKVTWQKYRVDNQVRS